MNYFNLDNVDRRILIKLVLEKKDDISIVTRTIYQEKSSKQVKREYEDDVC